MNNQNFNNYNPQNNQEFTPNSEFNPNYAPSYDPKKSDGESKASLSMLLGIAGLIAGIALSWCCTIFSIAGIVLDIISLVIANTSKTILGYEHSNAKIGKVCAIIGLVFAALGFIISIAILIALPIIEANFAF